MMRNSSSSSSSSSLSTTIITPYANDIRTLLIAYRDKNTCQVAPMKEEWKTKHFSMIHEGCPDEVDRAVYTQELFQVALGYLQQEDVSINVKIGALYILYLLYATQTCTPKIKIAIDHELFQDLLSMREMIQRENITDAYYLLNQLHSEKAFKFVSHTKIDLAQSVLDLNTNRHKSTTDALKDFDINTTTLAYDTIDFDRLRNIEREYLEVIQNIPPDNVSFSSEQPNSTSSLSAPNRLEFLDQHFIEQVENIVHENEDKLTERQNTFIDEWNKSVKPSRSKTNNVDDEPKPPAPIRNKSKPKTTSTSTSTTSGTPSSTDRLVLTPAPPTPKKKKKKKKTTTTNNGSTQRARTTNIDTVVQSFIHDIPISGELEPQQQEQVPLQKQKKKKKATTTKTTKTATTTTKASSTKRKRASSTTTATKKKKKKKSQQDELDEFDFEPNNKRKKTATDTEPTSSRSRSGRVVKKTQLAVDAEESENMLRELDPDVDTL
jgi:hypothetical protein